ncbi:MAG: lysophospholipid acyltransferase family protein [Bacteroidota bacterium]
MNNKEKLSNKRPVSGKIVNIATSKLLMQYSKRYKRNKLSDDSKSGHDFIDSALKELKLEYHIGDDDLKRIPKKGPFITVSNHPLGGLDALLVIKIISSIRPEYKFLDSELYHKVESLKDSLIDVKGDDGKNGDSLKVSDLKHAFKYLSDGGTFGIFPAGKTSLYNWSTNSIIDKIWDETTLKLIKKARVPIIPIYIQGNYRWLLHILGGIHPLFKSMRIPSELINPRTSYFNIRIGNPIQIDEQEEFVEISRFGRYLRSKTYALGTSLEVKRFFKYKLKWRVNKPEKIIDAIPADLIEKEMEHIKKNFLLFESGDFQVVCAPSMEIPNVLLEIGRLREITFREIGEGTNKNIDIDEFDLYYNQLIVWDNKQKKISGAYRVGIGKDIIEQYGLNGFYIQTLFKIKPDFIPILSESLELGRSFIVKEYQRRPLSLFLLWKGILYFLLKHKEYRYLIGPASISNEFSKFSKGLIVSFFKKYYYDEELAKRLTPRRKFRITQTRNVDQSLFLDIAKNIGKLDEFVFEIENEYGIPVLLKKYIKLNAKLIGFNVDPKFNNSLDGLIFLDIFDVPFDILKALSKEIQDDSILERFNVDMAE